MATIYTTNCLPSPKRNVRFCWHIPFAKIPQISLLPSTRRGIGGAKELGMMGELRELGGAKEPQNPHLNFCRGCLQGSDDLEGLEVDQKIVDFQVPRLSG